MKKIFSLTVSLMLGTVVLMGLSNCLKDKDFDEGKIQSVANQYDMFKVIELGLTGTNNTNFLGLSLDATNADTTINFIPVNLASSEPAPEDINVTLVKNDALVSAYNTANGTNYSVPTASMYAILNPGNVVTIPKGSYTGYLRIKFKPSSFLGGDYAFGYSIGSVDKKGYTISSNLKNGIVGIAVKNKYDGVYNLRGYHNRDPYTFPYNTEESLVTINGNTVAMYWNDQGGPGHPIGIGPNNQLSWYGSAIAPVIVFDPNTNLVTNVYNAGGSTPITMFTGAGAGVSRYDPATKRIYVYWNYSNNPLRAFFDTLTYVRPR